VADEDAYVGRSQADAPGVDGYVFVNTTGNTRIRRIRKSEKLPALWNMI